MKKISKEQLKNKINHALAYSKAAIVEQVKVFEIKTDTTTVQFNHIGGNLFTMVDLHDPYRGTNGYPKMWDGNIDAFYAEFQRELSWIDEVHKDFNKG